MGKLQWYASVFLTSLLFQTLSEIMTPCAFVSLNNNTVTSGQGFVFTDISDDGRSHVQFYLPDQSLKDESLQAGLHRC